MSFTCEGLLAGCCGEERVLQVLHHDHRTLHVHCTYKQVKSLDKVSEVRVLI